VPEKTQIADDIPLSRAWKIGRRVYVRAAYKSKLNDGLYELGSTWDRDEEARWVGTGKLEQVIALIREADQRAAETEQVKGAGHWAKIPYDATEVREQAKRLGARWDKDRKEWALPTAEALAKVEALIAGYEEKAQAAKAAKAERDKAARAKAAEKAAAEAARTDQDVIAASGRTVLSPERIRATTIMGYRGKRPGAEQAKEERGDVIRLRDGRRLLVLASKVEFWSEDDAEDLGQPGTGPGWRNFIEGVIVGPDAQEAARDAERQAAKEDGEAITTALKAIRERLEYVPEQDARRVAEDRVAARVSLSFGSLTMHNDGDLSLTVDGEVRWYHPGYYDDYRVTCGSSRDPEVVTLARGIFAGGSRERSHDGKAIKVEVRDLPGEAG